MRTDFSWCGVPWRRTLCGRAWTSSKTSCGRELWIHAIPRPGPSPSSVCLAPKVPLSQRRARRQRSGKCTTRSSDQAVGLSAKESVGPFPFDSQAWDPGDAGWHIDGSYDVNGQWWVNVHSRGRGLLALFLFTDVGDADAPTEILVGSHLDVPRVLAPFGAQGVFFGDVTGDLPASTFKRTRARATGRAGDVYVCHPFLVHRATWPHLGSGPRMVAQPAIAHHQPFALREGATVCAVERAILRGLG